MQLIIRSSDPDEIDVKEIRGAIEALGHTVSDIRVVDVRKNNPTLEAARLHKAEPLDASNAGEQPCAHCGQRVKAVPGGHGPTWVHVETGAVVGRHGPGPEPGTAG